MNLKRSVVAGVVCLAGWAQAAGGAPAYAQDAAAGMQQEGARVSREAEATCAPEVDHWVEADKKQHPTPEAPPDQALIYVIRPAGLTGKVYQSKLAVNAEWRGVNKSGTYFFFTLAPGEHTFCSQVSLMGREEITTRVEAGQTYYFQQQLSDNPGVLRSRHELLLMSPPRGQIALAQARLALFGVKKK